MILQRSLFATVALLSCTLLALPALACTGFFIKAQDGGVAYFRSMEFAVDLESDIVIVPRGTTMRGQTPKGDPGLEWTTRYGFAGMDFFNEPDVVDGMNEKGLLIGGFYFPDYFHLPEYAPDKAASSIAVWQMGSWILGNFATVAEVRQNLESVTPVPTALKGLGLCPPLHFFVLDPTGEAIVIEYTKEGMRIHDNTAQVVTNSPQFDWHLTNLRQYIKLDNHNAQPRKLGQLELAPLGQGSGMFGVPGDITSPSRFVRAAYYVNQLPEQENVDQALRTGMRLLQYFYITKGMVVEEHKGQTALEYTEWQSYADLKNKRYFFNTYDNPDIRMVDLSRLDFSSGPIRHIATDQPQSFTNVTDQAK